MHARVRVHVWVCTCLCVCVCVRVCAYACESVRVCMRVVAASAAATCIEYIHPSQTSQNVNISYPTSLQHGFMTPVKLQKKHVKVK